MTWLGLGTDQGLFKMCCICSGVACKVTSFHVNVEELKYKAAES